jgi:hypothetical protein
VKFTVKQKIVLGLVAIVSIPAALALGNWWGRREVLIEWERSKR